jgi:hypothetical protein
MGNSIEAKRYIIKTADEDLTRQLRYQIEENKKSSLLTCDEWPIYGSRIESYENDFGPVLDGISISSFVKQKSAPVVIDLMSPSDTLASLFMKISDRPKLGIALSYKDKRDKDQLRRDENSNIKQLTGDILELETWEKIEETLDGKKADLIMERALRGKHYVTPDIRIHAVLLNKAWKLLSNDHGMLLAEIPSQRYDPALSEKKITLLDWVSFVKEKNVGVNFDWVALRLIKTPNSPQNLPFLE